MSLELPPALTFFVGSETKKIRAVDSALQPGSDLMSLAISSHTVGGPANYLTPTGHHSCKQEYPYYPEK